MEKPVAPERADRRRALILLAALILLLAANLRPSYSVTVAGTQLPGRYGLRQTERCAALARETAEEILGREPLLPEPELHLRLSLGGADGDDARLTDALLGFFYAGRKLALLLLQLIDLLLFDGEAGDHRDDQREDHDDGHDQRENGYCFFTIHNVLLFREAFPQ